MTLPDFKIGSTFAVVVLADLSGTPVDLTGWTGTCQVRTAAGVLVAAPAVAVNTPSTGYVTLTVAGSTADWPAGTLELDVKLVQPDDSVLFTPTASFRAVAPETQS